jgi:hypothetical protein
MEVYLQERTWIGVYQGQAQSERLMVIVGLMAATTIEVE